MVQSRPAAWIYSYAGARVGGGEEVRRGEKKKTRGRKEKKRMVGYEKGGKVEEVRENRKSRDGEIEREREIHRCWI